MKFIRNLALEGVRMANPTSDNPKTGQNPQKHNEENDPRQQQHNDPSQQHGQQKQNDPMKDRRPDGNAQDKPSDRRKAS
jgi:hypothetical protein